jgi:Flp pilus assembly protein TadG
VLFALLIVPLLTLAAFAIDASQWQVGANQLQTAADAGALAGARAAQLYPNTASTIAPSYAIAAGSANRAFGVAVTVNTADVEPTFFNPTDGSVVLRTWTGAYNSVRVTVRQAAGRTLSGLVMSAGPTVTKSAVAWIANVNGGQCIKPWALPYTVFYDAIEAATGIVSTETPTAPSTNPPYRPNLSQAQIARMDYLTANNMAVAARTVIMRGPNTEAVNFPVGASPSGASLPAANQWMGYAFNGSAGANYQADIGSCTQNASIGANSGTTLPGGGTDYECWTINAIIGGGGQNCNANGNYLNDYTCNGGGCPAVRTCVFAPPFGATASAACYDPNATGVTVSCSGGNCSTSVGSATPGKEVWVVWGDGTGTGSNLTSYRQVGKFKLYCVFRYFTQGSTPKTAATTTVTSETCSVPDGSGGFNTYTNLPAGTIVGVLGTIGAPKLGNGEVLGNAPSLAQRLILVK